MSKSLTLLALLAGMSLSASADTVLYSTDSFSESDFYSLEGTVSDGALTLDFTQRAWIDLSSLGINLSTGSYTFTLGISGLTAGNGPVFSMTNSTYSSQITAFGFSTNSSTWAFSNNGNNMNTTGESGSTTDFSSSTGTLTVSFLYDSDSGNYTVEAYFTDSDTGAVTTLVSSGTSISYNSDISSDLTYLCLGGWGSTSNNGSAMTVTSLTITSVTGAVPEPATASLSLLGLGALLLRRRRH